MNKEIYQSIRGVVGVTFIVAWIYCIANYGFLLGVGLGWLPAAITALSVDAASPLVPVLLVGLWL